MKFADLVFEDLLRGPLPLRAARATFANGWSVRIISGHWAFAGETSLYELTPTDPSGERLPILRVRGDAAVMQENMDRIERADSSDDLIAEAIGR